MHICLDDLTSAETIALVEEHGREMLSVSPPESTHALDLDELRQAKVTFWVIKEDDVLLGCGALQEINAQHAEIKSMRTVAQHKQRGVASKMLQHIIAEAEQRGYQRLSLETGSADFFAPARKLAEKYGFRYCEPFAHYVLDPESVFMTKVLR